MAIIPRLDLRQSQTLVMTPQLQQAIKLLQLSNLELNEFVDQELERNPLLERAEEDNAEGDAPGADGSEAPSADRDVSNVGVDALTQSDRDNRLASDDGPLDTDVSELYDRNGPSDAPVDVAGGTFSMTGGGGGGSFERSDDFGLEQTLSRDLSLKEHLLGQLNVEITDPAARFIGATLVEMLDDAGYLREDVGELAARLGTEKARVENVLGILQGFDPAGVFARDLGECLALQLRERNRLDPAMQTFLDHLDLLAKHDFAGLIRACGVDRDDIRDMVDEVRALNPKPGLAFDYEVAQTVIPDVIVAESPRGGWLVELNTDTLPRVLVNMRYFTTVNEKARNKKERAFIAECMNTANWLVKSLDQRARTILKVASELVRQQDGFLAHGIRHLKPLNLRTIAENIEMHESTVSRVTSSKYMATPRGIFELKYFFTSAIASAAGGEAHSAEAVRHRIRELIDEESADVVLSDDKLVELLLGANIDIARRTVAKYREAMGIPSSVQRRRVKRAQL